MFGPAIAFGIITAILTVVYLTDVAPEFTSRAGFVWFYFFIATFITVIFGSCAAAGKKKSPSDSSS